MNQESDNNTAGEPKVGDVAAVEVPQSPLETLTSLVLDAADAANDSAQVTNEALVKLGRIVELNEETTRTVRIAPVIFGAVILGIGIVLAVVIAIIFRNLSGKTDELIGVLTAQRAQLERLDATVEKIADFEETVSKFDRVAEETTQRAMIMLREQTKADRATMLEVEAQRLKDILGTAKNELAPARVAAANTRSNEASKLAALEANVTRLDKRLEELLVAVKAQRPAAAATPRPQAALSDAQARELKKTADDVAALRKELVEMRALLERQAPDMQAGVPAFRKN
jgi:hypothetical protein